MSPTGQFKGNATIDGVSAIRATLSVHQETVDVSTNLPQPDPRWTFVDEAGHFHARSADGTLPTLNDRVEHRDCDGACGGVCEGDGYDVTVYLCRICGVRVSPGTVPGPHYATTPGLSSWEIRAVVAVPPQPGAEVSVRFDTQGGGCLFGVGIVHRLDVEGGGPRPRITVELAGTGPLGRIGPEPVVRAPAEEALAAAITDLDATLRKLRERAA